MISEKDPWQSHVSFHEIEQGFQKGKPDGQLFIFPWGKGDTVALFQPHEMFQLPVWLWVRY